MPEKESGLAEEVIVSLYRFSSSFMYTNIWGAVVAVLVFAGMGGGYHDLGLMQKWCALFRLSGSRCSGAAAVKEPLAA